METYRFKITSERKVGPSKASLYLLCDDRVNHGFRSGSRGKPHPVRKEGSYSARLSLPVHTMWLPVRRLARASSTTGSR